MLEHPVTFHKETQGNILGTPESSATQVIAVCQALVTCFSQQRPGIDLGPIYVGLVVDKVALEQIIFRVLRLP